MPNDIGTHPGYTALREALLTTYRHDWDATSGPVCEIARWLLAQKTKEIEQLRQQVKQLRQQTKQRPVGEAMYD